MEAEHGIKKLSPENWLEPDKATAIWVQMTMGTSPPSTAVGNYLDIISGPQLSKNVPDEVKKLFETARGATAYGWFFYPLFTLAAEQCYRVMEAAVSEKCLQMGGPPRKAALKRKLDSLIAKGVIPKEKEAVWNALRELRNWVSHPERQSIYDPGLSVSTLHNCAENINSLFTTRHVQTTSPPSAH
jgi:hypothetical protein